MSDLSKSCENLSAVMLYNPGLEFERQQREELEKLESKRKLIEEMEEKQKSDKAALERMQQEVETQRKETEIVKREIRKQEESLKRRSFHIENKLKDLLAEKEKFEEERLREQQGIEQQKRRQEEESFLRWLQELSSSEQAEKMATFQELGRLQQEKDEQCTKLAQEKWRLEEQEKQEKEQVLLAAQLEEQLWERQEMGPLWHREVLRAEQEKRELEDIRRVLLRARDAPAIGAAAGQEPDSTHLCFLEFKRRQLVQLATMEQELTQQENLLRKEVQEEQEALEHLQGEKDTGCRLLAKNDGSGPSVSLVAHDLEEIKAAECRLRYKECQLQDLLQHHLPALLEEKQRVLEVLDQGPLSLDSTLYLVEKEMEENEERLAQHRASACQLQQLQATFEVTTSAGRKENVRKKEKEIAQSWEKQQREVLERAVAKLRARHSARHWRPTPGPEGEEQRWKPAAWSSSSELSRLQAGPEAEWEALEKDQDRINAYIEEEVQRRLQDLRRAVGDARNASTDRTEDNEKLHNSTIQRKLKYERLVSRSLGANPDDLKDPVKISIPRYVLCGQGKDAHVEFQVKITVLDETWTVFRRYSRFREMHKTLKLKYAELAALEFPPKKLFGNKDERVIAERRSHLEIENSWRSGGHVNGTASWLL